MNIIARDNWGYYTVGEKKYPSVTNVMKSVLGMSPGLVQYFYAKYGWLEATKRLKEAGQYGTYVHDILY